MAERITTRHLERFAAMLNRVTKSPEKFTTSAGAVNVGHFYLEQQCGRNAIVRVTNDGGATQEIVRGTTARECYDAGHAWFSGWLYRDAH